MEPRRYGCLNVFDISGKQLVGNLAIGILCLDSLGRLVLLGCGIAAYTPAIYLRRRLQRPFMEILS